MTAPVDITQTRLKSVLDYNPLTGIFIWKTSHRKGLPAGCRSRGYILIRIDQVLHQAHRLAWLFEYGEHPKQLDHKNGKGSDNRIVNLREYEGQSFNLGNCNDRPWRDLPKGVVKEGKRFGAQIYKNRVRHWLGIFDTAEEAKAIYIKTSIEFWGEFASAMREKEDV